MLGAITEFFSRDVVAIVISLVSLAVAMISLKTARSAFRVNLREQWIEKFAQEFRACLPSNNISNAAGLRIARLADSMPSQIRFLRRGIIEHGFYREIPGGDFAEFWEHLCKIQGWPRE